MPVKNGGAKVGFVSEDSVPNFSPDILSLSSTKFRNSKLFYYSVFTHVLKAAA